MKTKFLVTATIAAYLPLQANAAIIDGYGVSAAASTASNCPSYCTTAGGGDFQYDNDGGEFNTSAYAFENSYAEGEAYAALNGMTYLPTLKVQASSDEGRQGSATAFGIQGFTYSGAATTINLDFNLHGSVVDNPTGYTGNTLQASVAVLKGSQLDYYADFSTLVYEVAFDLDTLGIESIFINEGINIDMPGFISFDIADGDDFYVVAQLRATGKNGYADAWNTLTLEFDDDTGLEAAGVVPVPAALWLFGSGLLGLVGVARRR
jgi:hypothetical protein